MQPNQDKPKLNLKRLLIIIFLIILVIVGYLAIRSTMFRVVSTNPSLSSVPDVAPYIDINFSKNLASDNPGRVQVTPNVMKNYKVIGKTLRINILSTMDGTKYSIAISGLQSVGNQLYSGTLSFAPKNIPYSNLPADEQKAIINNQDPNDPSLVTNNPLLAHLPYGGIGWQMSGIIGTNNGKPTLTIQVTISFSGAEYKLSTAQKQALIKQRETQALSYIKSIGLNPAKYSIGYSVPQV